VSLPIAPPLQPQLALSRAALPKGKEWAYEIKLDGFRCIAFVDGSEQYLQSRNGRSLSRYFPELVLPQGRYVLDGEIVVRGESGREDFDALGQRIHPAASRVELLSRQTPALYVAFDLLARDGELLLDLPYSERRAALEGLLASETSRSATAAAPGPDEPPAGGRAVGRRAVGGRAVGRRAVGVRAAGERPVGGRPAEGLNVVLELMPSVEDVSRAERWLGEAEGVIAKERSAPYLPGQRRGMVKVKRVRTIDAVVRGWRPGKAPGTVGALILGLYDELGRLREVGHCSGLRASEKRELVERLRPYETGNRGSGEPSRWSAGRNLEWVELRPELVVEVDFDHVTAQRIRHGAKLRRWRDDKDPRECTIDQLYS
jgi:ATP-dependent DNA ligase